MTQYHAKTGKGISITRLRNYVSHVSPVFDKILLYDRESVVHKFYANSNLENIIGMGLIAKLYNT